MQTPFSIFQVRKQRRLRYLFAVNESIVRAVDVEVGRHARGKLFSIIRPVINRDALDTHGLDQLAKGAGQVKHGPGAQRRDFFSSVRLKVGRQAVARHAFFRHQLLLHGPGSTSLNTTANNVADTIVAS